MNLQVFWLINFFFLITYIKKRLHLLQSDLYSIQAYWAKLFILPKKVIKVNEKKTNSFLWNGNDKSASGAKVSWELVCVPRKNGGLGLNKAVVMK